MENMSKSQESPSKTLDKCINKANYCDLEMQKVENKMYT